MRRRDQAAAGGEGCGERFQDEIACSERAADVGDWNRCGYVGYVGEERSYERGNHIGLFACGVEEDVEGASVSGLSGMAGQLGERGDACAVGDVLLRIGDDIEIVGKDRALARTRSYSGPRASRPSAWRVKARSSSRPIQPPLPLVADFVVPASAALLKLAAHTEGNRACSGDDGDAVGHLEPRCPGASTSLTSE